VIASAGPDEIDELRDLVHATDEDLEPYRPFAIQFGVEDQTAAEMMEEAIPLATLRRPNRVQLCMSVQAWASACRQMAAAWRTPPINRVASVVWLVRELHRAEVR
jgi:hypothetical protein